MEPISKPRSGENVEGVRLRVKVLEKTLVCAVFLPLSPREREVEESPSLHLKQRDGRFNQTNHRLYLWDHCSWGTHGTVAWMVRHRLPLCSKSCCRSAVNFISRLWKSQECVGTSMHEEWPHLTVSESQYESCLTGYIEGCKNRSSRKLGRCQLPRYKWTWSNSVSMNLGWTLRDGEGQGHLVSCSPWGWIGHDLATEQQQIRGTTSKRGERNRAFPATSENKNVRVISDFSPPMRAGKP